MTEPDTTTSQPAAPAALGETRAGYMETSADRYERTLAGQLRNRDIPNDPLARSEFLMLTVARQLNTIRVLLVTTLVIVPLLGLAATIALIVIAHSTGATPDTSTSDSSLYTP